tara:strand:- start:397 stop:576 length:180 start_codon:yes stop_codon:yes gene_type:complete
MCRQQPVIKMDFWVVDLSGSHDSGMLMVICAMIGELVEVMLRPCDVVTLIGRVVVVYKG